MEPEFSLQEMFARNFQTILSFYNIKSASRLTKSTHILPLSDLTMSIIPKDSPSQVYFFHSFDTFHLRPDVEIVAQSKQTDLIQWFIG